MSTSRFECPECDEFSDEKHSSVYYHAISAHEVDLYKEYERWPNEFEVKTSTRESDTGFSRENVRERDSDHTSEQNKTRSESRRGLGLLSRVRDLFSR